MYEEYVGPLLEVREAGDAMALGTWWWDLDLLARPDKKTGLTAQKAFDMLVKEHISEIYLEANPGKMAPWGSAPVKDKATLEQMAAFIGRCTATDMRVAALLGRGGKEALTWFADGTGYPEITSYIEGVAAYNAYVPAEQRFYGVHLDLEPDMTDDYLKYRSQMRRFLLYTRELCDRHGLQLELDVNAWFDDSQVAIDENGREVIMGDVVTTACDAITVMAYRANAADQLDIADYLIEAARRNHCAINIGCETGSPESLGEEAFITYANFPPKIRAAEQRMLREALEEKALPSGFALAVHWVNTWYAMNMQTAG